MALSTVGSKAVVRAVVRAALMADRMDVLWAVVLEHEMAVLKVDRLVVGMVALWALMLVVAKAQTWAATLAV